MGLDEVSETPGFGVAQQLGTALFGDVLVGGVGIQLFLRRSGLQYGAASSYGVRREGGVRPDD